MPTRNPTMASPFAGTDVERQKAEAAIIAGRVKRSPFTGEPVEEARAVPALKRVHPPVTDDPRRRANTSDKPVTQ